MKHFLVVFDRSDGRVVRKSEFGEASRALRERLKAERQYGARPEIEVVVLAADSDADLRRTHSRYFETVGEIVETGLDQLTSAR